MGHDSKPIVANVSRVSGGLSGITWKKKSRHGFPEVKKVGERFSVNPFLIGLL